MNQEIEIKKIANELLLVTTVHGLPNILRAEYKFLKLAWTLMLIVSIAVCVYFVNRSVSDYFDYDIVTNINLIYEHEVEFPTISFCSETGFQQPIEKIITSCNFDFDSSCMLNPSEYFSKFIDPINGLCYRFNSGLNLSGNLTKILKTTQSGYNTGLKLDMIIEIPPNKDFGRLRFHIHNKSMNPPSMLKNMRVSAGSKNYFSVNRVFDQKLGEPYNKCLKDISQFSLNRTIIDYINAKSMIYTKKECIRLLINLKYIENNKCGCNVSNIEAIEEECYYNAGTSSKIGICTYKLMNEIALNNFWPNYCPLECESINFSLQSSIVDYPSIGNVTENEFKSRFTRYEKLRRDFFAIRVYYEDLKYTFISQQPKTQVADLISSIGGLFGLFVGVSFLSFFEFIEIFFEIIFILFKC